MNAKPVSAATPLVVTPPVKVLWGLDDVVFPNYEELLDGINNTAIVPNLVEIVRLPNISHWVMHDAPLNASLEIAAFVTSIGN